MKAFTFIYYVAFFSSFPLSRLLPFPFKHFKFPFPATIFNSLAPPFFFLDFSLLLNLSSTSSLLSLVPPASGFTSWDERGKEDFLWLERDSDFFWISPSQLKRRAKEAGVELKIDPRQTDRQTEPSDADSFEDIRDGILQSILQLPSGISGLLPAGGCLLGW